MIDFSRASFEKICIHFIGNKSQDEELVLSENPVTIEDEDLQKTLMEFFFNSFKKEKERYNFFHPTDLALNDVFSFCAHLFDTPEDLHEVSKSISSLLYEISDHPQIKSGEIKVVYFSGCVIEDEMVDAIGIFKCENKHKYLKIFPENNDFTVKADEGIDIYKTDKACIIFNHEKENGYSVLVTDNINKSAQTSFWKEIFLNVKPKEDNYFHTDNYMKMCKDFISEKADNFETSKTEKADFLNSSLNYFKGRENFEINDFAQEVIKEPEIIDAFLNYKSNYEAKKEAFVADEFEISPVAVKTNQKIFKSVIKLDKNFHVYVHGSKRFIDRGYSEDKKMNYYVLYYNEEA